MAAGPTAHARSLFVQPLEPRQLLSTVSVSNFGAVPNDGKDDSSAIQKAVNAAKPGDTILFDDGTYDVDNAVDPKGEGRILQGQNTILRSGDDNFSLYFRGSDVTITGFTFKGRGIFMDRPKNQMVEGVVIDNNRFQIEISQGSGRNSIYFTTGLRDSRITNNRFDPIKADNGIYGYNWENLTIANNEFVGGNEGIHLIDHTKGVSKNLLIEQNYFSDLHRMGIELQGGGERTIVQDNWYENPVLSSVSKENADTFAYSIINDRSTNALVRRNAAIMPTSRNSPDGIGVKIIFELGGKNLVAEDNYAVGGNHVVAANGTQATGIVRNNRFINYRQGPANANGSQVQFVNNGSDVNLTWSLNRGRPGVNQRYAGTSSLPPVTTPLPEAPAPLPQPDPIPLPDPVPLPDPDPITDPAPLPDPDPIPVPDPDPVDVGVPTESDPDPVKTPDPTPDPDPSPVESTDPDPSPVESTNPDPVVQPTPPPVVTKPAPRPAPTPDVRRPSSVVASAVSETRVDLSWLDTSPNELGFKVERSTDGRTFKEIGLVAKNRTAFSDFDVTGGTFYYYRVRAFAASGDSAYSNVATVVTDAPPPPPEVISQPTNTSRSDDYYPTPQYPAVIYVRTTSYILIR